MDAVMTWPIKSPAANSSYPESSLDLSLMGRDLEPEPSPALLRWGTGFSMEIGTASACHRAWRQSWPLLLGPQGCFRRQEVSSGALFPSPVAISLYTQCWTWMKLNCCWKLFHWQRAQRRSRYCSSLSGFSAFPCSPQIFPLLLKPAPQVVAVSPRGCVNSSTARSAAPLLRRGQRRRPLPAVCHPEGHRCWQLFSCQMLPLPSGYCAHPAVTFL